MEMREEDRNGIVIGVIENRAREVGLAALDVRTASLHLSQFIETSRSYQNTVTLLQFFDPSVIVLSADGAAPDGMVGLSNIVENCVDAQMVPLARRCFDDHKGIHVLNKLAIMEANAISSEYYQKQYYLCIGAAAAVLNWTENQTSHVITKNSLKVIFNGSSGHMNIDATSIMNLEVIRLITQDSDRSKAKQKSLYCMLNTTKTVGGARLLRANLLQPLKTLGTINSRLDCLDDLMNNEQLFGGLSDILQKLPKDTDKLLCNLCVKRNKITDDLTGAASMKRSQILVAGIILVRETLNLLPLLLKVLCHAECSMLRNIKESLGSHPGYVQLRKSIAEVMAPDIQSQGRASLISKANQFSIVKAGVDGFLDVARTTFNNTSDAIHKLCSLYREKLALPKLRLLYSNRHGYYISIPLQDLDLQNGPLPSVLIKVVKRGNYVHCSSDEFDSLNSRNKEAAAECYMRTERCLEDLTNHIREHMHLLLLLSESLSLLDMMVNSFANFLSTKMPNAYIRPGFSESGPLVIEAGRHPVLEDSCSKEFVPNNTFLAEVTNVILVSGPNMSGKSTYLRQVALITILAHIGCYVPANFASFRIVDHLFTRLGTGDNLELNSSTFMTEMRETAFLMQYLSCRSLVLIDELGRATSTSDGFAISWSCCEFLLSSKAYVIFATHMQQLSELSNLYPDAQSCSFAVDIANHRVDFKYVLKDRSTDVPHYGLLLSEIAGVPPQVVSNARKVTEKFLQKRKCSGHTLNKEKCSPLHEKYHIARRLICLQYSQQTREPLLNWLKVLKERHSKYIL